MSIVRLAAAAALALLASQSALAGCYRVYAADNELLYRSYEPPVDMSRQIHETLPKVAPGGTLVFTLDEYGCDLSLNNLPVAAARMAQPGMRPARADRG